MAKINFVHVLMGGLVAGVIVNVWGVASGMVFAWAHPGQEMPRFGPAVMVLAYVIGITAVWLYASISARYGRGLKTTAIAVVVVWTVGYAIQTYVMWDSKQLSGSLMAERAGMTLAELFLATLAGAWVYHRPASGAGTLDRRPVMGLGHRMFIEAGAILAVFYVLVSVVIAFDINGFASVPRGREAGSGIVAAWIWPANRFSVTAATHALVAGTVMLAAVWGTVQSAARGPRQTLWLGRLLVVAIGMVPLAVGLAWIFSTSRLVILVVAFLLVRAVRAVKGRVASS